MTKDLTNLSSLIGSRNFGRTRFETDSRPFDPARITLHCHKYNHRSPPWYSCIRSLCYSALPSNMKPFRGWISTPPPWFPVDHPCAAYIYIHASLRHIHASQYPVHWNGENYNSRSSFRRLPAYIHTCIHESSITRRFSSSPKRQTYEPCELYVYIRVSREFRLSRTWNELKVIKSPLEYIGNSINPN